MISLSWALAGALEDVSGELVSLSTWDERIAHLQLRRSESPEDEHVRWDRGLRLAAILAKDPRIPRLRLRALFDSTLGEDTQIAGEALKAARLDFDLPTRVEGSDWFAAVPLPVTGSPIRFVFAPDSPLKDDALLQGLHAMARRAGWTTPESAEPLALTVSSPENATWGAQRGAAISMKLVDRDVAVEGFGEGPPCTHRTRTAFTTATQNLLAHPGLGATKSTPAAPTLDRIGEGTVCLARTPSVDPNPLSVRIDRAFMLQLAPGTYTCLDLPEGMFLRSHDGTHQMMKGERVWFEVAHGNPTGSTRLKPLDEAKAQKLEGKGRITQSKREPLYDEP